MNLVKMKSVIETLELYS